MTNQTLGWIGVSLLVIGVGAIAVEGALAGIWSLRLARRGQELSQRLAAQQRMMQADVEDLRATIAETAVLWQPYGRALRFLRHPLVIALLQSFARRRTAAR